MSNKFCGSDNGVENYLSNIICWQTCQTLLSICRKHSVAHHKACRTFSVEHFDVENLPWSMGKCIVEGLPNRSIDDLKVVYDWL